MHVIFTTPHLRISGGVKVILKVANGLARRGVKTTLLVTKSKYKDLEWFDEEIVMDIEYLDLQKSKSDSLASAACIVEHFGNRNLPHPNIPRVLYLQGVIPQEEGKRINIDAVKIPKDYDLVVTTSSWLRDLVAKTTQVPTRIIPPGIDEAFSPRAVPSNRLLTLGTLHHPAADKNFKFFVNMVIKLVQAYGVRPYCTILSSRGLEKIRIFDYYCLPYSIIKLPPQGLLPYIYSACDLWVSPSEIEGFGLTTLEAMACGVPTLWVPSKGLADYMVQGKNCIIVNSPTNAAKFIKKIKDNTLYLNDLGTRGRATAEQFTWEKTIDAFHELITERYA